MKIIRCITFRFKNKTEKISIIATIESLIRIYVLSQKHKALFCPRKMIISFTSVSPFYQCKAVGFKQKIISQMRMIIDNWIEHYVFEFI